jgi:hypothetical protein
VCGEEESMGKMSEQGQSPPLHGVPGGDSLSSREKRRRVSMSKSGGREKKSKV